MRTTRRWAVLCAFGLGLGVTSLSGCQTWEGGMTLPSGRYLDHPPQYFPPDPDFRLARELATQEEQAGLIRPIDRNFGAAPAPVPGFGAGLPLPGPVPAPAPVPGKLGQ